jgi:hypothetical protein
MPEFKPTPVAVLALILCLSLPGFAAEPPAAQPGEESLPTFFDRFFGHRTFAEELQGTQLRVNVIGVVSEAAPFSLDGNAHVKLQLPLLRKRLHLLLSGDSADDPLERGVEGAVGEHDFMHREDDVEDSLALQHILATTRLWHVSAGPGVRFDLPPEPFLKFAARRTFTPGRWELSLVQGGALYLRRGVASKTQFIADHPWGKERLLRGSTGVTWSEEVGYAKLDASAFLFHFLPGGKAFKYQLGIEGTAHQMSAYHASISCRRNIGPPWLFAELKGALLFPREEDFDITPSVLLKLEGIFGGENELASCPLKVVSIE